MKRFALSASRTADGVPVYLDESGGWCVSLNDAETHLSKDDRLLQDARSQEHFICDPFWLQLNDDGVPKQAKFVVRAAGEDALLRRLGYGPDGVASGGSNTGGAPHVSV